MATQRKGMATQRKCGACGEPGHTRRTCTTWQQTGRPEEEEPQHTYESEPVEESIPIGCSHPDGFEWADDGNGHSGSFCSACGAPDTAAEKLRRHQEATEPDPFEDPTAYRAPSFVARFDSECDVCDGAIFEGDMIRACKAGPGGFAHEDCNEPPGETLEHRPKMPSQVDVPDFEDPTPATPKREKTGRLGYLAKDPRTGEFNRYKNGNIKGFTRVSTFIKAGSDRTALTKWEVRNVLLGAVHFPDVAAAAKVLHPHPEGPLPEEKDTKEALNRITDDLSQRIGSKKAADEGTAVHNSIDRVARGNATLEEIPSHHVPWVRAFLECLESNGLELMPDMVEQTVFLPQFGGVMGRFDQTVKEKSTGRVLMTDNKTGSLDYAFDEIEGQLSAYTAAYTQYGTYEWHDTNPDLDRWVPPRHTVDATEGIVFHLPVKSGVPQCHAIRADLRRGWEHMEHCARAREKNRNKPKPEAWVPSVAVTEPASVEPAEPEDRDWVSEFAQARDKTHLKGLYESAHSVFGPGEKLDYLVSTGQARLAALAALATADKILGEAGTEPPF